MDVIRYHTTEGVTSALRVKRGSKYTQIIVMNSTGIRLHRVPNAEEKYMTPLPDYPIEKAKAHFRSAVKRFNKGHTLGNNLKDAIDYDKHKT